MRFVRRLIYFLVRTGCTYSFYPILPEKSCFVLLNFANFGFIIKKMNLLLIMFLFYHDKLMLRSKILTSCNRNFRATLVTEKYFSIKSAVCWMGMYDEPEFLISVPGRGNRLFQALAHYISGDDDDFPQVRQAVSFFCALFFY